MGTYYVTTPIYYVNDLPHIGHIFTTTAADTLARYWRLAGHDVHFLTGTDEHGQKIERAARKEGITPQQLADRVVEHYHQLREPLGFSYDVFMRTTEERHHRGVQELIRRMSPDDFYTAVHEGWYCSACETFYTEKELLAEKRCPVHETPAEWKSESNIFFRLSKYQQPLLDLYQSHPELVQPPSRLNEVRAFVSSGLRDLSVSRANLEWGIPFPGHPGQTVYVWLDALTNYITALGFGDEDHGAGSADLYKKFWDNPDSVRIHLMGKDILRFHAVYWPAFLMSAGLPLPTTVWAHGWWQRDGRKMSKSTGNVVRPGHLIERFGADGLRYFFLREMVFGQDATFSDEAFIERYNSDLANDLGNTVSRVVTLSRNAFEGKTPPEPCDDNPLIAASRQAVAAYHAAMKDFAFQQALEALWRLLAETNQYVVTREPWKLIKTEGPTPKLSRVLWNALEATRIVATALLPFMPKAAEQVLAAIGCKDVARSFESLAWGGTPNGAELPEPRPIFPRIDKEAYLAELKAEQTGGAEGAAGGEAKEAAEAKKVSIDQFFETELKVATVVAAEAVPKSNKLLKLTLDAGEGAPRTVVSGIAQAYKPEDLVDKQVVLVANLNPAKLMGIESNGMVLAASIDGKPVLVHPAVPTPPGTKVK
ncbi:MAG TPA: methionine--tRNA ligase [Thermoanaerobaculia bacterium]|nr:methionine--tRNA ligase [Thermoanaerobaculia bacterium]